MTLNELIPTIQSLSHADKFRLVQIVLQQLAAEDGVEIQTLKSLEAIQFLGTPRPIIMPKKSLRGVLKHYANSALIDREATAWLDTVEDQNEPR